MHFETECSRIINGISDAALSTLTSTDTKSIALKKVMLWNCLHSVGEVSLKRTA